MRKQMSIEESDNNSKTPAVLLQSDLVLNTPTLSVGLSVLTCFLNTQSFYEECLFPS